MTEKEKQIKAYLQIREYNGIERLGEPVTIGVPFPIGEVYDLSSLCLEDKKGKRIRHQASALATWPDKSIKWGVFDFQADAAAHEKHVLTLMQKSGKDKPVSELCIKTISDDQTLVVDTGAAVFTLDRKVYKPFASVKINAHEITEPDKTKTFYTDRNGETYEPVIDQMHWETDGPIRKTLKLEGRFPCRKHWKSQMRFVSRIFFYLNQSYARIDFTLLNPNAAEHVGGLWDLGDPGSILFSDLSLQISLKPNENQVTIQCIVQEDTSPSSCFSEPLKVYEKKGMHLNLYQDSSGGNNWNCRNHLNRNREVRHRFKGFKLYSGDQELFSGARAIPVIEVNDKSYKITGTIKNFWQNFPTALEGKGNVLIFRLFPSQYNDFFEIQGGEQKTHTVYLSFDASDQEIRLNWTDFPLMASANPDTYAKAGIFPYLVPDAEIGNKDLLDLVNLAVEGSRSFFERREIIDEYGWRNFGELYADHEVVGNKGDNPFISHYNNQYDCINGFLYRFAASGDFRWFVLADQLSAHVKDIDIYHTQGDRLEFNYGLFWHTNHYMEAKTATHRCYSRFQVASSQAAGYGGGPALSHCYTTGLLNHYYMTGENSSKEAVLMIGGFVERNYRISRLLTARAMAVAKRVLHNIKSSKSLKQRVIINKIYNLNGPGRASGNALNALVDAFNISEDPKYLRMAEEIILLCIHPEDEIESRELMDIENRWMYTVFLQALMKYLTTKKTLKQFDSMWCLAKDSLLAYARWMVSHEKLYLDQPDKLDFPNETWPAQDFRKACILKYSQSVAATVEEASQFGIKAENLFEKAFVQYKKFDTRFLTRPIVLTINNAIQYLHMTFSDYIKKNPANLTPPPKNLQKTYLSIKGLKLFLGYSMVTEWQFIKWHIVCYIKNRIRNFKYGKKTATRKRIS